MARTATPETFFDAAMRLLAGPGLPALRIGRLCREVGVTSGSFYHHFGSWDGFVAALLQHWAAEEVDRPLELVRRAQVDDPVERVTLLKGLALTIPHDAETAIRRWAGTDRPWPPPSSGWTTGAGRRSARSSPRSSTTRT